MNATWRNRVVVALAMIAAVTMSAVAASAADIGPLASRIFSVSAPVTYPVAERSVTSVALTTSGSPATVSAATITVTGSTLSSLNGQSATLMLLDASNVQLTSATATLASGGNLTVGATTATITLTVTGSPTASSVKGWAVFIAGVQVLDPAATSTVRNVVVGNGTFPVVVTPWQQLLVNAAPTGTTVLSAVTLTTATTTTQCVTLTITATGPGNNAKVWALDFDYAAGPFWGTPPSQIQKAQIQSTTGTVYRLVGTTNGTNSYDEWTNNKEIRSSQSLDVIVCQNNAPAAPNRTEAYTTSAQFIPTPWTPTKACIAKTVTGNGTYPFYFGWQVTLDAAAAFAYLRETDPAAPRSMDYTPDAVSPAFSGASTSYTVGNYRDDAISGTGSQTVTLCFNRF